MKRPLFRVDGDLKPIDAFGMQNNPSKKPIASSITIWPTAMNWSW